MAIPPISVSVQAKTDAFRAGMNRARAQLLGFSGAVKTASTVMRSFGGVLSGAAGISAFKKAFLAVDDVQDVANQLNISENSLIGLQVSARRSTTDIHLFAGALQQMAVNTGMAAQGLGRAGRALSILGLDAKKVASLPIDIQFQEIAKAIEGVDNASTRAFVASKVFGNLAVLDVISVGGRNLRGFQQEAEKLGLTLTDLQSFKVGSAITSFTRLKDSFAGLARTLVVVLAPVLETLSDMLSSIVQSATKFASKFEHVSRTLTIAFAGGLGSGGVDSPYSSDFAMDTLFDEMFAKQEKVLDKAAKKRIGQRKLSFSLGGIFPPLEGITKQQEDFAKKLQAETRTPFEAFDIGITQLTEAFANGLFSEETFSRGLAKLQGELFGVEKNLSATTRALREQRQAFKDVSAATITPFEEFEGGLLRLMDAVGGGLSDSSFIRELKRLQTELFGEDRNVSGGLRVLDTTRFAEVDLSRQAFGRFQQGSTREQKVRDPQLETANKFLSRIMQNTSLPVLARTSP